MHNAAFAHHGLDYAYLPLRVRGEDLGPALEALRVFGFRGANVTLPHKEAILPYLDAVSDLSKTIGAVNTVVQEGGRLFGTTTDPVGFMTGFTEAGFTFDGKKVAVLGSGGSARTIAFALFLLARPAEVFLVGRKAEKMAPLVEEIRAKLGARLEPCAFSDYGRAEDPRSLAARVDVVVNATPVGMEPNAAGSPLEAAQLRPGQVVYDIVYVPEKTRLLSLAEEAGLAAVGGLGMLVHQGCESFRLWTGVNPDVSVFFGGARDQLRRRREAAALQEAALNRERSA